MRLLITGVAHNYIGHRGKSLSTNNSELFLSRHLHSRAERKPWLWPAPLPDAQPHDRLLCRECSNAFFFVWVTSMRKSRSHQPVQELYGNHAGPENRIPSCARASHITGIQQFSPCYRNNQPQPTVA